MASSTRVPDSEGIEPEDRDLIERIATRVVELRMELPALLTLESGRPLSLLASQTLHFFQPIVGALVRLPDYQRFARLIERRETIELLMAAIETRAEAAHKERRASKGKTPDEKATAPRQQPDP